MVRAAHRRLARVFEKAGYSSLPDLVAAWNLIGKAKHILLQQIEKSKGSNDEEAVKPTTTDQLAFAVDSIATIPECMVYMYVVHQDVESEKKPSVHRLEAYYLPSIDSAVDVTSTVRHGACLFGCVLVCVSVIDKRISCVD